MVSTVVLVAICGGLGSISRFLVDGAVQSRRLGEFPLGTLVVNLTGSFTVGLLAGLHTPTHTMLILGTATVGSYTTFSTWMLETHRPAEDGEHGLARQNFAISLAAGLAAVLLGRVVGGLV